MLLTSCASLSRWYTPLEEIPSTPLTPQVDVVELRTHLEMLNHPRTEGRLRATPGLMYAAEYLSERLHEYGLQPMLDPDYLQRFPDTTHQVLSAELIYLRGDSLLRWLPEPRFLPDGRSDQGTISTARVLLNPRPGQPTSARAVMILADRLLRYTPSQLRAMGIRVLFLVGTPRPTPAPAPWKGLIIVQLHPTLAAHMTGLTPEVLMQHLLTGSHFLLPLPSRTTVRVTTTTRTGPSANVGAFLAGKHVNFRRELVLILAEYDGIGPYPGWPPEASPTPGTEAAALLEVARIVADYSAYLRLPERTLLFLWVSGERGLAQAMEHFVWSRDHVVRVLYVEPHRTPARQKALLKATGWPVDELTLPDSLRLLPGPSAWPEQARYLALQAHAWLTRWYITPHPFAPADPDTLAVPSTR